MGIRATVAKWLLQEEIGRIREEIIGGIQEEIGRIREVTEEAERIVEWADNLRGEMSVDGKDITIHGLAGVFGNITDCTIRIEPRITPRIVLAEVEMSLSSALAVDGRNQVVRDCSFTTVAVKAEGEQP